jgi:viroplasmin and RNaseH domain-containing protein
MTSQTQVFLVTHGYRDREIDGIFKTKEKAEEYCKEKNESLEQLLQKTHLHGYFT